MKAFLASLSFTKLATSIPIPIPELADLSTKTTTLGSKLSDINLSVSSAGAVCNIVPSGLYKVSFFL